MQVADPDEQLIRIQQLRTDLRDAFDPLMRCTRVIVLEGPSSVAEHAEAITNAASDANTALWAISQSEPGARARFDELRQEYRFRLGTFIDAARTAMSA
jgi:hypothetical protein